MSEITKLVKDVAEVIQTTSSFTKEKDFKKITQSEAVNIIQLVVKYQKTTGTLATTMAESLDRMVISE